MLIGSLLMAIVGLIGAVAIVRFQNQRLITSFGLGLLAVVLFFAGAPIFFLLLLWLIVWMFVFVKQAFGPLTSSDAQEFCKARGIESTALSQKFAVEYLTRIRKLVAIWTMAFTIPSLLIPFLFTGKLTFGIVTLMCGLTGYLVGAIVAELHDLRPKHRTGTVTISVETRNVSTFAVSNLVQYLVVVTGLVFVSCLMHLVVGESGKAWSIGVMVSSVTLFAIVELAQRAVALRARTSFDEEFLQIDNAIRTASIESIRAIGLALAVMLLAWQANVIAYDLINDNAGFLFLVIVLIVGSLGIALRATDVSTRPIAKRS